MRSFCEAWASAAAALLPQAVAGAPELAESSAAPMPACGFGFAATLSGAWQGRFSVFLESGLLELPLLGEGVEQRQAWGGMLREIAEAAAGALQAGGEPCRVTAFEPCEAAGEPTCGYELRSAERAWSILLLDAVEGAGRAVGQEEMAAAVRGGGALPAGLELLLDVELEAALRFGSREMPLGDILDLGPGDVVQLDRHVSDPVDLLVGDKIVARGEVVLINGNFGLRVTEVAEPRKRLESIRCLF
jgi:flagellar motor switch protein FliN